MDKKARIIIIIFSLLMISSIIILLIISKKEISSEKFNTFTYEEKAKYKLKHMTLEEKIAQMLIVYYNSETYDETLSGVIKEVKPGGIIITAENISTYDKTLNFIKNIKKDSEIPMIISIDQEGGLVQRLLKISDKIVTDIPHMYDLGETNNTALAYEVGKLMAEELRTIGVNLTFAPVLDIFSDSDNEVIGKRSFSSEKEIVSSMALSVAKGLEDNGIKTCYKHFPGHGDTKTDSHVDIPIVNKELAELMNNELAPFDSAIKEGAEMIMVGHIAVPKITNDNTPASLSKVVATDILKEKLNYNGLIITDALNMGALSKNYTEKEIYVKTINAGVDILLMPNGSEKTIEYILEAIDEKEISKKRINESVIKILEYKYKNLENYEYLSSDYLNSEEHQNIIKSIKGE